jgi:hypothetical protein
MSKPTPKADKKPEKQGITGVAFSFEAAKDQGFSNYRILTLFLVDGELVHTERSQPYATYEALAKAEVMMSNSIWNLSARFRDGLVQGLGSEDRDRLFSRLSPEIKPLISPALGIK